MVFSWPPRLFYSPDKLPHSLLLEGPEPQKTAHDDSSAVT